MVAAQTAGCLGVRSLLGETALDVLKVAAPLAGLALCGVDAPVGGAVVQPRGGDVHIHRDLMPEAQILVDVGGRHLTGGDGADGCGRPGDAVAYGEQVAHVAHLPGQSRHERAALDGDTGLLEALDLDALSDGCLLYTSRCV